MLGVLTITLVSLKGLLELRVVVELLFGFPLATLSLFSACTLQDPDGCFSLFLVTLVLALLLQGVALFDRSLKDLVLIVIERIDEVLFLGLLVGQVLVLLFPIFLPF